MMSALFFSMACSTFAADDVTGIKMLGDANGDDKVNGDDITIIVEYIKDPGNESVLSRIHLKNANATKDPDGKINGDDITAIVEIIKGNR